MRITPNRIISAMMLIAACAPAIVQARGPAPIQPNAPEAPIVFMSRADSPHGELYWMDTTGRITRLTDNERHENNPALSHDGTRIAFHGGDEASPLSWEIFVLDIATGDETQLTDNGVIDGHPDWSPDGTRIVFGSFRDAWGNPAGAADIYVMALDSGELGRLTDSPYEDNDPEWSPDGSMIVFKSGRRTQAPAREEIYVMDADGSNVRQLTTTEGFGSDHDPSWSPDSQMIVFSRYEGTRPWTDIVQIATLGPAWIELMPWNVHAVTLDGEIARLTKVEHAASLPVYAPESDAVVYLSLEFITRDGNPIGAYHRLVRMAPDGSGAHQMLPEDRHTYTLEYFDW